jgi:CNT family concentrative nucleoside transporter
MQRVVQGVAWVMARFMGTSGAESLSVASNIFVGQTEAPLLIRPYVSTMTMSELMAVMTGGFATIAGGVMAAYVRFGVDAGHLMAASVMSAPAALVMAKIIFPETAEPKTKGEVKVSIEKTTANVVDAAASGAADGLKLAMNVGAMLLAFIALIAMLDFFFLKFGLIFGWENLSLKKVLGFIFSPIALVMGVETADIRDFGYLLGTKVAINEFVAYVQLGEWKDQLSPRSFTIATYALCGFANFSSIAIQIGGIGGIAPERKQDLARIGLKAMIGGALASWLTATIAGILI